MRVRFGAVIFIICVLSACRVFEDKPKTCSQVDCLPLPHLILKCDVGPVANQDAFIRSILQKGELVLASTEDGLYRASLVDKQWNRLICPDALPVDGSFPYRPRDARDILYNASEGLFVSNDNGQTWHLISNEYRFGVVYLHKNGTLYVTVNIRIEISEPITNIEDLPWRSIELDGDEYYTRDIVLMSKDFGQSWKDITGNIGAGVELMGISQDPDHPDLVILTGVGIRGYVLQASDGQYDWKMIRLIEWNRAREKTEKEFFARSYSSGTVLYRFGATLSNYFEYDFGSSVTLPALDIVPDRTFYEFTHVENKSIQVTVRFLHNYADNPIVRLVDTLDYGAWAIRVLDPAGEQVYVQPASSQFVFSSEDWAEARRMYRAQQSLQWVEVSKAIPYTRTIDLDSLFDFSEIGVHKVQLLYDNHNVADRDQRDEWVGMFSSRPFTVTIVHGLD